MSDTFRASNGLSVEFISSYAGQSDYGVYLRRLDRRVRVRRDQATGDLGPVTSEATEYERTACVEAVREYLASSNELYFGPHRSAVDLSKITHIIRTRGLED